MCACGLREDGSGMLVSVSRGVSSASNIAEAAAKLRDDINLCRVTKSSTRQTQTDTDLKEFQRNFIIFALKNKVLQFGSFVLKSGRTSPYFFNAGLFCSGTAMRSLGRFYAQALREAAVEFDVIFGPAYKGIPLATAIGIAWYDLYGEDKDVTFNRKEVKDHGEGGNLVGGQMRLTHIIITIIIIIIIIIIITLIIIIIITIIIVIIIIIIILIVIVVVFLHSSHKRQKSSNRR